MTSPSVAVPRVNIVMRTRNRRILLERAIADVLAQDDSRWFLTIVNDGGQRESVEAAIGRYDAELGARVAVIHRDASTGMEAASNAGIRSRPTEFVAIHDDDDTWAPSFLRRTLERMDAEPQEVAVGVRTEIVWEEIVGSTVQETSREIFLPHLEQVTLGDLLRFNTCVPISMLYRRDALDAVGLFDEKLGVVGDWECHLRLSAQGPIGFLAEAPLAYWHQRPNATGDAGNSVIALRSAHRRTDRLVRDDRLRAYTAAEGFGLPLYLTRYLDDRFEELNGRLAHLERVSGDTVFRRVKSLFRRMLRR